MPFDSNIKLIFDKMRQIENDVSNLAWRSFTTSIVFDDIFIDNLSSVSAINWSQSSYLYDSVNDLVYKPTSSDMTITTNPWSASQINPSSSFCLLEIIPSGSGYDVSLDIRVSVSTNNGSSFTQFTNLHELFVFQSTGVTYLKGEISGLTEYGSDQIVLKMETLNDKDIKISAYSVGLRF